MLSKSRSRSIYAAEPLSKNYFLLIITTLALLFSFLSINVQAETGFKDNASPPHGSQPLNSFLPPPIIVTAPTANQAPVGSFVVPITFSNTTGDGIIGFQFNLDYDPAVIDPISDGNFGCSTAGTISAGLLATCNVTTQGTLRVVVFGAQPISGAGTALKITFVVDPAAVTGNFSPLNFRNLLLENPMGAVAVAPVNGVITLVAAPTSANVSVGGRVLDAAGGGIADARITIIDSQGNQRITRSSSFGYYRFDEVTAGRTYILSVLSRRYEFAPQVVFISEDNFEINFNAIAGKVMAK